MGLFHSHSRSLATLFQPNIYCFLPFIKGDVVGDKVTSLSIKDQFVDPTVTPYPSDVRIVDAPVVVSVPKKIFDNMFDEV